MWSVWEVAVALCLVGISGTALADEPSVAFFYGPRPPVAELSLFDRVVVEPAHLTPDARDRLVRAGTEVYGYFSVGEVAPDSPWRSEVPAAWTIGHNPAWGGAVLDPSREAVRAFLLSKLDGLWRAGFRGFFLDTLDSPLAARGTPAEREARRRGLVEFIRAANRRFPGIGLMFNRGFELLPEVAPLCRGVAAESLFARWDAARKQYTEVPAADRAWLEARLDEVKGRYRLPAIVIDYVPPSQRERARQVARAIAARGYTPYVTDAGLQGLGLGAVEPVPRRVLALYDGSAGDVARSLAHRLLAAPLEHLGYAVDAADVRGALPGEPLAGRYAGVVTWFTGPVPDPERYRAWLLAQLEGGVRVAVFGQFGFEPDRALLERLGLAAAEPLGAGARIAAESGLIGFEAPARAYVRAPPLVRAVDTGVQVHLAVTDNGGAVRAAVLTAPWGGLALEPYVLEEGYGGSVRWVLEPFGFLRAALALPALPAPDVTTESGRRVLTAQVDGDGFGLAAEAPGAPPAGEVIAGVLERHPLPVTVSFVQDELTGPSLSAAQASRLEESARRIARMPWVELASHSASHPKQWGVASPEADAGPRLDREVDGSVRYLEERVAPPGKRVRAFLWPEDAQPDAAALAATDALGLANVNGGFSQALPGPFSITDVSPLGRRPAPDAPLQVYRPGVDDSAFTRPGAGTPSGYTRVIETLQRTDAPRRLAPLALSFHFSSGVKPGGAQALEKVYRWAESQETVPLWLSEYAALARDFDTCALGRRLDGGWELRTGGALRTLRLDPALGYPDMRRSEGVAGFRELPQGRYVALDGRRRARLQLAPAPPATPFLVSANARVERWEDSGGGVSLRLAGHQAVRLTVSGVRGRCRLRLRDRTVEGQPSGEGYVLDVGAEDTGDATLVCP